MLIDGQAMRTLWVDEPLGAVFIINQILLPHDFRIERLESLFDAATAIRDMQVRGAPLIGVTAAYGVALAMRADSSDAGLKQAVDVLGATRPTAVNPVSYTHLDVYKRQDEYHGSTPQARRCESSSRPRSCG